MEKVNHIVGNTLFFSWFYVSGCTSGSAEENAVIIDDSEIEETKNELGSQGCASVQQKSQAHHDDQYVTQLAYGKCNALEAYDSILKIADYYPNHIRRVTLHPLGPHRRTCRGGHSQIVKCSSG